MTDNDVKCKDCEFLMFSDCYGECSKAYKGIVSPNDSCGKGMRKGGNMTDNEIIKALECHKSKSLVDCERCPLYAKKVGFENCHAELFDCVFDLINRQKADIEELEAIVDLRSKRKYYRKFVDEVYQKQKGNELFTPDFDYIYELYFKQRAEIDKWKAECENQSVLWRDHFESIFESAKETIRAEAIKEFLEMAKSKAHFSEDFGEACVSCYDLDNLAKEMTGDQNDD